MSRNLSIVIFVGILIAFFSPIAMIELRSISIVHAAEVNTTDRNIDIPMLTEDRYDGMTTTTNIYIPAVNVPIIPAMLPPTSGECELVDCFDNTFDYLSFVADYR
jgi:hypothetical protein